MLTQTDESRFTNHYSPSSSVSCSACRAVLSRRLVTSYSHLQSKGWRVEREHLLVNDFPVQFLATFGLTEEAVRKAKPIEYEGVPAKVFVPNTSLLSPRASGGTRIWRAW